MEVVHALLLAATPAPPVLPKPSLTRQMHSAGPSSGATLGALSCKHRWKVAAAPTSSSLTLMARSLIPSCPRLTRTGSPYGSSQRSEAFDVKMPAIRPKTVRILKTTFPIPVQKRLLDLHISGHCAPLDADSEWIQAQTPGGTRYEYSLKSGQTRWIEEPSLSSPWQEFQLPDGRTFWVNTAV